MEKQNLCIEHDVRVTTLFRLCVSGVGSIHIVYIGVSTLHIKFGDFGCVFDLVNIGVDIVHISVSTLHIKFGEFSMCV
jgi:hypothetical protein